MTAPAEQEIVRARTRLANMCSPKGFKFLNAWTEIRRDQEVYQMMIRAYVRDQKKTEAAARRYYSNCPDLAERQAEIIAAVWPAHLSDIKTLNAAKIAARLETLVSLYPQQGKKDPRWQIMFSAQLEHGFLRLHQAILETSDRMDAAATTALHDRITRIEGYVNTLNQRSVTGYNSLDGRKQGELPHVQKGQQAVFNMAARALHSELKRARKWCHSLPAVITARAALGYSRPPAGLKATLLGAPPLSPRPV
ncbi:MAG: hypothetical protein M3O22_07260 [Pseudomonadota bacterium]|nr:hypothetical protein [Pseudomonadota bacterium]